MRRRHLWEHGVVAAAAVALTVVSTVPAALATDPVGPTTPPTTTATTSPPTTVAGPGASTTTLLAPNPSSTTSTTSTVPGTTLPPVDDATIDAESAGYSTLPAPLIPNAEDDPLFHAALTVDADLVALSKAQVTYLRKIAATRDAASRAAATDRTYDEVAASDAAARRHLENTRSILRAAALHAYAGYGSVDTAAHAPQAVDSGKVLPYKTYVRVTIADATDQVSDAQRVRARTSTKAQVAGDKNDAAQAALRSARAEERAAKKAVADAKKKLDRDRDILRLQIAAMPGMAPGALDRLPDDVELPEGASRVESPVGTIVVPATADPRTVVALQFLIAQIGKPYVWGATGPSTYDCSGLTLRAFQAAGVTSMPRVSQGQQVWATPVDAKDAQPGDFVFFGNPAYHVGVYIGGGLMIDAPFTGARVRIDRVWPSVTGYGRAVW